MSDALSRHFGLEGKVAVVTGGASGFGKATARLFAAAGATVVVADMDTAGAETVATEIGGIAITFDLDDDASIAAMVAETVQRTGRLDVLVNNAAIYPRFAMEAANEADWQRLQKTNVWGCFVTLRECARAMRAGGQGGRIINVSSIGGARTAVDDQILYNATKAALDSMTKSAALELASDGILVNSVLPGAFLPLDPKPRASAHVAPTGPLVSPGRIPLGRYGNAYEVAGPILMLASAAGSYCTGQTLIIDGGFAVS